MKNKYLFKRSEHTDEMGKEWFIYEPTVMKKDKNVFELCRENDSGFCRKRKR